VNACERLLDKLGVPVSKSCAKRGCHARLSRCTESNGAAAAAPLPCVYCAGSSVSSDEGAAYFAAFVCSSGHAGPCETCHDIAVVDACEPETLMDHLLAVTQARSPFPPSSFHTPEPQEKTKAKKAKRKSLVQRYTRKQLQDKILRDAQDERGIGLWNIAIEMNAFSSPTKAKRAHREDIINRILYVQAQED
jgi:hypothetical protein